MKIILATGAPGAGHEAVFAMLAQAGVVSPAAPARNGQSPEAIGQALLARAQVDVRKQFPGEQLSPGGDARELAQGLVEANQASARWGWADPQVGWLLDFWRQAAPRVGIVLAYSSPADFLAARLQGRPAPANEVQWLLRIWNGWNTSLLRYHLRHQEQTVLVNARAALRHPRALGELLQQSWDVKAPRELAAAAEAAQGSVLPHAAEALIPARHEARALLEQLENASGVSEAELEDAAARGTRVWAAANALVAEGGARDAELARLRKDLESASRAAAEAAAQAAQLKQRCESLQQEATGLKRAAEKHTAASAAWIEEKGRFTLAQEDLRNELAAVKADKELQLLQLHQVQEEAEKYFSRCHELEKARADFAVEFWRAHPPEVVTLDLRRHFVGDQWYDAEVDGRWSGPAALSTLDLPAMPAGTYLLELDVVDTLDPALLEQARIECDGQSHELAVEFFGEDGGLPAICSTTVAIQPKAGHAPLRIGLRLPGTVVPADQGGDDYRSLGVRVQQLRLVRQAAHPSTAH